MQQGTVVLGGPVHVADFGGRGRPIVLVHGLGGSHVNWLAVGPRLAALGKVRAPDLIGFGLTPPDGRSSGIQANLALLEGLLRADPDGPSLLVGNSLGGLLSLLLAARSPELVEGLVLVCPALPRPLRDPLDPDLLPGLIPFALPGIAETALQRRAERIGPEGVVDELLRVAMVDPHRIDPEVRAAHVELARQRLHLPWSPNAFLHAARSMLWQLAQPGLVERLARRVRAPVLIVHGEGDRLASLMAARRLAQLRPDWELEVLDDVGHVPQLEDPDRFVAVVAAWVQRTLPPRAAAPRHRDQDHIAALEEVEITPLGDVTARARAWRRLREGARRAGRAAGRAGRRLLSRERAGGGGN